ncbi:MAG: hypothetical protein RJA34_1869 [Pseudomonadota bacterium]|jgi:hypothetical protein
MSTLEYVQQDQLRDSTQLALRNFIAKLKPNEVYTLCMSGSIWVAPELAAGEGGAPLFVVAGCATDSAVSEWAAREGLVLLIDLNGLADVFALEGETPDRYTVTYAAEVGRKELMACVGTHFDGCWDGFLARLHPGK